MKSALPRASPTNLTRIAEAKPLALQNSFAAAANYKTSSQPTKLPLKSRFGWFLASRLFRKAEEALNVEVIEKVTDDMNWN